VPDPPAETETPSAPRPAERSAGARGRSRRKGRSALVYLSDGTSVRGSTRGWDPSVDVLELRTKEGDRRIEIDHILVAFMGPAPGRDVEPEPEGRRVKVELTNGKRLVGVTSDYEAGRDRFTLLPDARSSGVDRVWIPASSVRAIAHA
jgi:small nuclear ribonucleoprotein (snRNP)-like protein